MNPFRSWSRHLVPFWLLCATLSCTPFAFAMEARPPIVATTRQPVTPATLNAFGAALAQAGAQACAPLAARLSDYLLGGAPASVFLQAAPERPNQRILSAVFELDHQGVVTYLTVAFSPYAGGGCGASYDAVTYWEASCAEVAQSGFSNLRFLGPLRGKISMLDGGDAMRVFLLPTNSGCVQVKKETIFEAP